MVSSRHAGAKLTTVMIFRRAAFKVSTTEGSPQAATRDKLRRCAARKALKAAKNYLFG
jgi:hypothetical protein